jgi:hypothetical protein
MVIKHSFAGFLLLVEILEKKRREIDYLIRNYM